MGCKHRYVEDGRAYTPPASQLQSAENVPRDTMERILFGITVIVLRCENCGDVETRTGLGDLTKMGAEHAH